MSIQRKCKHIYYLFVDAVVLDFCSCLCFFLSCFVIFHVVVVVAVHVVVCYLFCLFVSVFLSLSFALFSISCRCFWSMLVCPCLLFVFLLLLLFPLVWLLIIMSLPLLSTETSHTSKCNSQQNNFEKCFYLLILHMRHQVDQTAEQIVLWYKSEIWSCWYTWRE